MALAPPTPATTIGGGSGINFWSWGPYLAVGLIAVPFIVHQNAWVEWSNALWLLDLQTAHVAAYGIPTYFIDAPHQYFYPQNVFYAGPALSFMAYPAVILGTWPVFAAFTAGSFVAASAGLAWTARNLGVPPRLAIVPGVLFALTPYRVADLYGGGAWAEPMAVGAIGIALGAATSLTSGQARSRSKVLAVLALAVAAVAGMHNITLLFCVLLAPLVGLALLPLLHGTRRELIGRHALVLVGAAIGVALCGAFLIPDVWLAGRLVTGTVTLELLRQLHGFDAFSVIFDPGLGQPAGTVGTDLHTQTLVAPLVWLFVAAIVGVYRRRLDRRTIVALALLGLLGIAVTLLITHPSWWYGFPLILREIQFPFRLVTYLALFTVLGVIALLASPAVRGSRLAIGVLLLVTAWQVAIAMDLALTSKARGAAPAPTPDNISAASTPPAFGPTLLQAKAYRMVAEHPVSSPGQLATVAPVGDDTPPRIVLSGSQPPGSLVGTNVVASPLIRLTGEASIVGANPEGFAVLRVDRHAAALWHASVTSICKSCLGAFTGEAPFALLAGRLASVMGALALVGLIAVGARRLWGSRVSRRTGSLLTTSCSAGRQPAERSIRRSI